LLKQLMVPPYNITAVGDDDQAIYRFRGASHGQFQMLNDAFPDHETVHLDRNYRSTKRILRLAGVLIGKNERYENKAPLRAETPEGEKVVLLDSPDYLSEAAWVACEIERLVKRGISFEEIAVLYRAHSHRDPLVAQFRRRKIPFAIRGLSILAIPIVRDLVAY